MEVTKQITGGIKTTAIINSGLKHVNVFVFGQSDICVYIIQQMSADVHRKKSDSSAN